MKPKAKPKPKVEPPASGRRRKSKPQAGQASLDLPPVLADRVKAMGPPVVPGFLELSRFSDPEHTGKKKRFLIAFAASGGNVARAATAAGTARSNHYEWLKLDAKYKAAFEELELQAAQVMEDEGRRRALEGTLKGVYYKGSLVDFEVEYSDRILIQMLKARHPAHKTTSTVNLRGAGKDGAIPVEVIPAAALAKLTEEQVLEHLRVLRDAEQYVRSALDAAGDLPTDPGGTAPIRGADQGDPDQPDPGTVPG